MYGRPGATKLVCTCTVLNMIHVHVTWYQNLRILKDDAPLVVHAEFIFPNHLECVYLN